MTSCIQKQHSFEIQHTDYESYSHANNCIILLQTTGSVYNILCVQSPTLSTKNIIYTCSQMELPREGQKHTD